MIEEKYVLTTKYGICALLKFKGYIQKTLFIHDLAGISYKEQKIVAVSSISHTVYVWYETTAVIDIMQCLQPIDDIRMSKLDGSSCQGPEKTPAR